jgi:hypothetical protein
MNLSLETVELTLLVDFAKEIIDMLRSNRLDAIEAVQLDHEARLTDHETRIAALEAAPGGTDFGPAIAALQTETADLRAVLDAVDETEPTP